MVKTIGGQLLTSFGISLVFLVSFGSAAQAASTFADVSLVRERASAQIFLVVGNVKFSVDAADFGRLGFRAEQVQVVDDHTLDPLVARHIRPTPAMLTSEAFATCTPKQHDFESFNGKNYASCPDSWTAVRRDVLVAGWLEPNMPFVHRRGQGIEDVYYDLNLDVRFLDRMYGPGGVSDALYDAKYPVVASPPPIAANFFADFESPTLVRGVTANSWATPAWSSPIMHNELDAWNKDTSGGNFTVHQQGLGAAPTGWTSPLPLDPNVWFAFDISNPEGTGALTAGSYVLLRGTLFQDAYHDGVGWGWLEIHPVDWVVRIDGQPSSNARLTVRHVSLGTDTDHRAVGFAEPISPDFQPSGTSRFLEVRTFKRLVDYRFTSASGVSPPQEIPHPGQVDISASIHLVGISQTYFKATWLVGWRELDHRDRVFVDDVIPAGASTGGDGEGWVWAWAGRAVHGGQLS